MIANERGKHLLENDMLPLPPPVELSQEGGLRQVLCLLVLGQLSDSQSILQLCAERGIEFLARCRTDDQGTHLILGSNVCINLFVSHYNCRMTPNGGQIYVQNVQIPIFHSISYHYITCVCSFVCLSICLFVCLFVYII